MPLGELGPRLRAARNHTITAGLSITPPGGSDTPLTVANDQTNYYILQRAGTFRRVELRAKSGKGPTGAALILDIRKYDVVSSTWTSLWSQNTANRPQIAAGAETGSTRSFDLSTFNAGDLLSIDVKQVGSTVAGSNITVAIEIEEFD